MMFVSFQLKGSKDLKGEVDYLLELLHMEAKRKAQTGTLSGGQKRKVCVGIALIGGSEVSSHLIFSQ